MTAFDTTNRFAREDGTPEGTGPGGGALHNQIDLISYLLDGSSTVLRKVLPDFNFSNPFTSAQEPELRHANTYVYDRAAYSVLARAAREELASRGLRGQTTPFAFLTEEQYVDLLRYGLSRAAQFGSIPTEKPPSRNSDAEREVDALFKKVPANADHVHVYYTFEGPGSLEDQLHRQALRVFGSDWPRDYEKCASPTEVLRSRVTGWIRAIHTLQSVGVFPEIPNEARCPSFENDEAYQDAMRPLRNLAYNIVWQPMTDEDWAAVDSGDRRYATPQQLDASRDAAIALVCEKPHFIFKLIEFLTMEERARTSPDQNYSDFS